MRKAYLDTNHGQIHARFWHEETAGLPLLCLPPAPHTGLYYSTLSEHLNYPIIAVDYPGSGGSTPLQGKPSISDYASIIGQILSGLGKVNLLGFHSGSLVALELARMFENYCEQIICVDIPFFDLETRQKYAAAFPDVQPPEQPSDLSQSFNSTVAKWRENIGESRALELWVESLRAGPRYNDIFQVAFAFDAPAAFAGCERELQIIATTSSLLEGTRNAAQLCANGKLTEIPEIKSNAFETGAPIIAPVLAKILADSK